jgi:hypothetical protein
MAIKHTNSGACNKCSLIFNKYPNFYAPLRDWFFAFQHLHPEAHISCAGRGEEEQESLYFRRASRAEWGQSAHNYGAAIDIFEMTGHRDIYETVWFHNVLAPALPKWLTWYGRPGSKFYELPHVEVTDWRDMAKKGLIGLVE